MGQLIYDATTRTTIDDRALAHLQIVMVGKLRRQESFAFSWKYPAAEGDGRSTVWIAPELPLHFRFSGSRPPAINPAWVDVLMDSANSAAGLHLLPEPQQSEPRRPLHEVGGD
ncbi:hypothetical protein BFL36_11765 [Clavibacter michiganensis]|uniref:DUF7882 domain-containing protein n=1 Tax=Clavibacter michiganensis TaxID=28447 RepID=A0A251Y8G7_9MICO|nr:ATP-dependent DNA ligase [Clavibacter michiganensis]OUE20333.1 hypothetical protein BFL36_11765 [Clavibacter michiganensis]